MNIIRNYLVNGAKWIVPKGLYDLTCKYAVCFKALRHPLNFARQLQIVSQNRKFQKRHSNQRCFILCNGPSVNRQDLLPLKEEFVFSVSSGYHHPLYPVISPRYHCVPQITYGLMTKDDTERWFREMDEKIGDAELFLNITEESLVKERGLFPRRKVNYVCFGYNFTGNEQKVQDIAKVIPHVASVSIMSLMIALYMGFKQIYLLGVEHDSFYTNQYKYFYTPMILKGKDCSVDENGVIKDPLLVTFQNHFNLWRQYRIVKTISQHNGISIYNATLGGALDEFDRVDFDCLF